MKPKLISTLLILPCLLSTFGCKKNDQYTESSPFQENEFTYSSNSDYDPNAAHGEKLLYGKDHTNYLIAEDIYFMRIGGIAYGSMNDPQKLRYFCFDPLCSHEAHGVDEGCSATINNNKQYPCNIVLDLYDHVDSPVLYLSYRRSDLYTINGEVKKRDSVSCIERQDLTTGKRTVVLDGIQENIVDTVTYGDYVYYVLANSKNVQSVGRVHKSSGESVILKNENISSYTIVQAIDEKLYFIADNQYLYCCDLDLTNTTFLRDISEIKGESSTNGLIAGAYGNYLYYIADVESVMAETAEIGEKGNCYRVPLDTSDAMPELIAEDMVCSDSKYYRFTENTLYYQPAFFEFVDISQYGDADKVAYTALNASNGTLYALDLDTRESTTVVENCGMDIILQYASDERVLFSGWPYHPQGVELSNGDGNIIMGYKSGAPHHVWFDSSKGYIIED